MKERFLLICLLAACVLILPMAADAQAQCTRSTCSYGIAVQPAVTVVTVSLKEAAPVVSVCTNCTSASVSTKQTVTVCTESAGFRRPMLFRRVVGGILGVFRCRCCR